MTPSAQFVDSTGGPENGNFPEEYPARILTITRLLGQILPNIPVEAPFIYAKHTNDLYFKNGACGKAMVRAILH